MLAAYKTNRQQGRYLNAAHAIPRYFTNPAFFRIIHDLPHFFGVVRILSHIFEVITLS